MAKLSAHELETSLAHFTGTDSYTRWSMLYPKFLLTDGALYLARNAEAFWLMDVIGSYQRKLLRTGETFQVWTLTVKNDEGVVICDDGNGKVLVRQRIPYTDFPLASIKLYASWDGSNLVILLPSEY